MDYHVFIVSRIKELVDRGTSTEEAVARGIAATASTVTAAAAVMVAVFAIFASLTTLDIKQMGVGLAVAVLIDATVIRGVLLPATMKLLGAGTGTCRAGSAGCRARAASARPRGPSRRSGEPRAPPLRTLAGSRPPTPASDSCSPPLVLALVWLALLVTAWIVIGLFAITPLVIPILLAIGTSPSGPAPRSEAALARSLLGARIELPPRRQSRPGFWRRVRAVLFDRCFWRAQAYLVLRMTLGFGSRVGLVVAVAAGLGLLSPPPGTVVPRRRRRWASGT